MASLGGDALVAPLHVVSAWPDSVQLNSILIDGKLLRDSKFCTAEFSTRSAHCVTFKRNTYAG